MKKDIKGFTLEYILFSVVIIVIAAVAVTLALTHHKKSTNNSTRGTTGSSSQSAQNTSSNSQSTDPYAGWKTYTSTMAGYSLRYPSDWSLKSSVNNGGAEDTILTGPNGFEVTALSFSKSSSYWQQLGSSAECGSDCQTINQTTTITVPGYGKLDIDATTGGAGGGTVNELLLLPSTSNTLVASPTKSGIYTTLKGVFQRLSQQQQTAMTSNQFLASTDTKTAASIYESLSY